MEEDFVKEYKIKELTAKDKDKDIIKNVIKAKAELECAINNFEYAENDLIDYFSIPNKSKSSKVRLFIKKGKKKRDFTKYDRRNRNEN